jgi:hypothetical protein
VPQPPPAAPSGDFEPPPPTAKVDGGDFVPPPLTPPPPQGTFAAAKAKLAKISAATKPAEEALRRNWSYAVGHPMEDVFDVLGGFQRTAGGIAAAVEHHDTLKEALDRVAHDVFHPGDLSERERQEPVEGRGSTPDDATFRDTESIRALFHAPTHEAIDHFVATHVPEQLRGAAGTFLKGGEDIALQTISDPTTYVGGFALKGVLGAAKIGVKGLQAVHTMTQAAQAAGALKYMPWLPTLTGMYGNLAGAAVKAMRNPLFRPRAELDQVLNEDGRAVRMQIESKWDLISSKRHAFDRTAVDSTIDTVTRGRAYAQALGISPKRVTNIVRKLVNGTPEERLADLNKMRQHLYDRDVAKETSTHLAQYGGYKPGTLPMTADEWRKWAKANPDKPINMGAFEQVARVPRALMQAKLFLNPLPHGLKNVGELSFLAGGPRVVFDGIRAMLPGGVDAAMKDRMARIGLEPAYTHQVSNVLWSKVIPGYEALAGGLQDAMGRMEQSWRASLLKRLDRKLGKSNNDHDEYLKAYMVNKQVGDYKNVNGFVKFFQAIGGPWVAFRLGIVPQALIRAVAEHPDRVEALARLQEDPQRNRSAYGQRENTLEEGGPIDDATKLAVDPVKFMKSPASAGIAGQVDESHDALGYQPLGEVAGEFAGAFNPLGGVGDVAEAIAGRGMPGPLKGGEPTYQKQTLADRLVTATLATLAIYFHANPSSASQTYERREQQSVSRKSHGFVEDFLQGATR